MGWPQQSDPERDAGLIRQYEGGLARAQSGRLRNYTKYIPDLTDKERQLLGLDDEDLCVPPAKPLTLNPKP